MLDIRENKIIARAACSQGKLKIKVCSSLDIEKFIKQNQMSYMFPQKTLYFLSSFNKIMASHRCCGTEPKGLPSEDRVVGISLSFKSYSSRWVASLNTL